MHDNPFIEITRVKQLCTIYEALVYIYNKVLIYVHSIQYTVYSFTHTINTHCDFRVSSRTNLDDTKEMSF